MNVVTSEIRVGVPLAGRYRVLRRIGAGGMATVFLAEDERLGREVAIKRLHTDAPDASLRRFKQEARLGAALNHPNLVSVYDTVSADEGALIVMEYVEGRSLAELAGGRRLGPGRALPILRDVAAALDHAHSQGVVHRDVKPGNVIVGDDGTAKLADLGIARAIGATQITSEGSVVGTLPYMSPERLAGPGAGGPESDVYSLAAVAFELLSGKPPSDAVSTSEAAARPAPDLGRDWPEGPEMAVSVLERGLDEDPARRQPSAGRLVDDLDAAMNGNGEGRGAGVPIAPTPSTETTATRVATETARFRTSGARARSGLSRPAVIALLALVLLAVGGVALSSGGGDDGGDSPAAETSGKEPKADKPEKDAKEPAPAVAPAPAAGDEPSAEELNDLGFSLIGEGRYEEAIPVLERAVDAADPSSLTYAFALYNLGDALIQAGRPEEAIPVLQERLEIPNQQEQVRRKLEEAYAAAGGGEEGFSDEDGPGRGNGPDGKGPPGHDDD